MYFTRAYYTCPDCGQKASKTDAVEQQGPPERRLYAVEFYCEKCDEMGLEKSEHKGYKGVDEFDKELVENAREEWKSHEDLRQYTPQGSIPEGAITASSEVSGNDVFDHGYNEWQDMFLPRQLLCLSKIMKAISEVEDQNAKEYLLLAFSDSLMFQSTFSIYNQLRNNMEGIFRMNSYVPQSDFVENNVWGAEFGRGNFRNTWDKLLSGVQYAHAPTDRYMDEGEMVESAEFAQPIGRNSVIYQDDMRNITSKNEYDAVITDPPYYDNIIYSEVADYFYVWQKLILNGEYPGFDSNQTPRSDSIVTNPFLDKTAEDFEHEIGEALEIINDALKEDGTLAFTYHHSDEESWGELLESLCENGFEVTATYPINSDLSKFIEAREAVSFDIVIVARPTEEHRPISWNSLRRQIHKTAQDTRESLEENRDLKSGDIGVIEMGKCFQEYSKHHGEVRRAGEIMSAKDVVDEIYGIIQEGDHGEQDVYLDLLEEWDPSYSDLNKHLKRSDASEETMKEMHLFRTEGNDFVLCDWADEKRQAYVQNKVQEDNGDLTALDKAHFLRYRFEQDKSPTEYLEQWDTDELQDVCEGLAEATGDDTYLKMLGVDTSLLEFTED